jgi:hypothetical protein
MRLPNCTILHNTFRGTLFNKHGFQIWKLPVCCSTNCICFYCIISCLLLNWRYARCSYNDLLQFISEPLFQMQRKTNLHCSNQWHYALVDLHLLGILLYTKSSFHVNQNTHSYNRQSVVCRRWSVTPSSSAGRLIFILILVAGSLIQFHWKAALVSLVTVEEVKVKESRFIIIWLNKIYIT